MAYEVYKEGGLLNDRYQKLEDISEGAFGLVSLARDIKKAKLVAVKYIFKEEDIDARKSRRSLAKTNRSVAVSKRLTEGVCEEAIQEINIQEQIGFHPYIISLLDYFDSFIILEYCSRGDLYEAIKADAGPTSTKDIVNVVLQLIDAVEFVHNKSIYHRDIKPENILISDDWSIRLTDWGLASTKKYCNDFGVGSERYMAPELFDEKNIEVYDASKVDIWSIGICFLNIVFHKNPFGSATHDDKSFNYFARNREALFDIFSSMSIDLFTALRYSLTIDPDNRDLLKFKDEISKIQSLTIDDDLDSLSVEEGYSGTEPIKIENKAVGRKALAIPTPNTYINNHFHDYKKERFNRKDFFTPPSVSAHYMENFGKNRKNNKHHYGHGHGHGGNYHTPKNTNYGNGSLKDTYHLLPVPSTYNKPSRRTSSSSTGKYVPPNLRSPNVFKSPLQNSVMTDNLDLEDDLFVLEEADSPNSTFGEELSNLDQVVQQMDLNDSNYLSDSSSVPSLLIPMPLYGNRNMGSSSTIHNRSAAKEPKPKKQDELHNNHNSHHHQPKSSSGSGSNPSFDNVTRKYVPPHHRADYPKWAATHRKADSFSHHHHTGNNQISYGKRFFQKKNEIISSSVPTRDKSDWFPQASKIGMDEYDEDLIDDDFENSELFYKYAERVGERTYDVNSSSNGSSKKRFINEKIQRPIREETRELTSAIVD